MGNFAKGTTAKAQGTTAIDVGAVGYFKAWDDHDLKLVLNHKPRNICLYALNWNNHGLMILLSIFWLKNVKLVCGHDKKKLQFLRCTKQRHLPILDAVSLPSVNGA